MAATAQFATANTGPVRAPQTASKSAPLIGVVSLRQQRITVFDGTTPLVSSPISSGMEGHRTPKGVFSILQKNRWHESNIYSGAEMPFMQRLTWSGIALHAGNLPGYPASHGCVRLPAGFAERLFAMTRMGGRFIVADDLPAPQAIAHDLLPQPLFRPVPQSPLAQAGIAAPSHVGLLIASAQAAGHQAAPLLNPLQFAELNKQLTRTRASDSAAKADELKRIAAAASELHREARADRIEAEQEIAAARRAVDLARVRFERAAPESEERAQADASLFVAEEHLATVLHSFVGLERYETEMADEAMAAALAAKDAMGERERAEGDARVAARGMEPVSVFISRKTKRLYVRQGFEPVLEASVDFLSEDQPVGTHVFTATDNTGDGRTLSWTVVSVADATVGGVPSTARAALDGVRIEPAVLRAIAERTWVGASVMISDQAPSHETGNGTDFIVLTK